MYGKAFREFYEIIDNMSFENTQKIPKDFIDYVFSNIDWDYKFVYDKTKKLEDQELLPETSVLLTILYLRYFASQDEKLEIIKQMKENDIQDEKEKSERYKVVEFVANRKKSETKFEEQEQLDYNKIIPVVFKEKWYQKFWNQIKSKFNKN